MSSDDVGVDVLVLVVVVLMVLVVVLQAQMHSKENQVAQVKNELSRIRVDALNTTAHNDQLKVLSPNPAP